MPDGKITFSTDLDNKGMEKKLSKLPRKIEESEKKLNDKKIRQSALKAELKDALNEAKKTEDTISQINARISELQSIRDTYGIKNPVGLSEAQASLKEQTAILNQQNKEAERIGNQYTKITDSVIRDTESLNGMKVQAAEITDQLAQAEKNQSRFNEAIGDANKRFAKLQSRITKLASRALIFSVITAGLRKFREYISDVISANDEASAAIARLRGALLTLAQPLVEVIIPAFTTFVNILTRVISLLSRIVSRIFGKTAEQSSSAAKALYEQRKALNGVGKAASSASKSLAGFDEINTLQSTDNSGGASSAGSTAEPDFSGVIDENISGIEAILGGALLVIGAILAFSGANIPLGIGLMAAGALTLADAVTLNWDAITTAIQGPVGTVIEILSGALLVIGAVLAFTGANIPLGIGLMVAGAIGMATAVSLNWDDLSNNTEKQVDTISGFVSGALIALGAILAFSGASIPLGIGLMAVGAVGIASLANINWDTIEDALQGPVGAVTAAVSAAVLALGAILAFSGANIALGIGLIIAGSAGLAAAIAPNWDAIQTSLQGPIGTVTGIVSAALLVLGIILLFTGAGIPLGLGLIAIGAAGLAAAIAPNWDSISQKLKEVWAGIKDWWNTSVAKYFTADFWATKGKEALNGLIGSIERGLNNALSGVGGFVNKITGFLNKIPGVNIGRVSWGNIRLPRLAQGAVIPPNREFMAVLGDQKHGTNIEAPLSTIQEAVAIVMDDMIGGMMAGFESNQSVLQAILEAVNTIDTSDERYANAVDAYHRKVAVAKGV